MKEFFPKDVVETLASNVGLITDTTFTLILSHMKMKYKIDSNTVSLSLELHSLISDTKYDFAAFITSCSMVKRHNQQFQGLLKMAAKKNQKLFDREFFKLI